MKSKRKSVLYILIRIYQIGQRSYALELNFPRQMSLQSKHRRVFCFKVNQKEQEVQLVNSKNRVNLNGEGEIKKDNQEHLRKMKMKQIQSGLTSIQRKKAIHFSEDQLKMKVNSEKLLKRKRRDNKRFGEPGKLNIKSRRKNLINLFRWSAKMQPKKNL